MRIVLCLFICLAGSAVSLGQEPKLVHVLKGHKLSVRVVVFSPDSKLLASSQDGGDVRLWDVSSGRSLSVLYKGGDHYGSLAFSPNGRTLAGSHDCRRVSLWDVMKRIRIGTIEAKRRFPMPRSAVAFQPDGKTLVWRSCDSDDSDSDRQEIVFTRMATLKNADTVEVDIGRYLHMTFSPDCRLFAVGNFRGDGDVIALCETATGRKLTTLKGHSDFASDLTFSPDGRMLAAAIAETVKLWDVATGKHLSTFAVSDPTVTFPGVKGSFRNDARGIAFSPDSKTIAFGNSCEPVVELWDVATCKKITALKGNPLSKCDGIASVAISPDGKMLAAGRSTGSGTWDETIELWDIRGANKLSTTPADARK